MANASGRGPAAKNEKAKKIQKREQFSGACGGGLGIHPELKDYLGYSLTRLGLRIRHRMEHLLEKEGLHAPQCGILRLLHAVGPLTQVELGQFAAIDKATMVRFLDTLEEKGFAIRKEHPDDRRAKVLTITAKGSKVLEKIKVARLDAEEAVLQPLSPKERAEFRRILAKLAVAEMGLA
ncbi:MAG: MarR family transcriptional regulator [Proteobacteria bacterium]|nr:MAG: MarR family transcriptional regulator [Pseudomonadota bacterium]